MDTDPRRFAPAAARNREPIHDVLRRVLPPAGTVLEIASGSGEHTAYLAERLPALIFQPSDPDPDARASVDAWSASLALPNVRPALALDVTQDDWGVTSAGAVVCINMIHIAPWACCEALLRGAARLLPEGGPLYLYGPYKFGGAHTAASNEAFDASLRGRNPLWGVRDLDEVVRAAGSVGLVLEETVAMPANNFSVILRRAGAGLGAEGQ